MEGEWGVWKNETKLLFSIIKYNQNNIKKEKWLYCVTGVALRDENFLNSARLTFYELLQLDEA